MRGSEDEADVPETEYDDEEAVLRVRAAERVKRTSLFTTQDRKSLSTTQDRDSVSEMNVRSSTRLCRRRTVT